MTSAGQDLPDHPIRGLLHVVLFPTEACNFRCTYCYEEFQQRRMEQAVVRSVKSLLTRRAAALRQLAMSWFGGEPTLACDIIEDILLHVRSLRHQHPTFACTSNMTTNGYLLSRALFERLLGLGITQYQITFDGPRESHDSKRVLASGAGTFDQVWANVARLREVDGNFTVLVRLHVSGENQAQLPGFIDVYQDTFGEDRRFELLIRPLSRLRCGSDSPRETLEEENARQVVDDLVRYARERHVRMFFPGIGPPICYAACADSFVVRADGRINKCTVALEDPRNQIGTLCQDGRLELVDEKYRYWTRGLESGDLAERACPRRDARHVAVS
jgi:uncharacterized protein